MTNEDCISREWIKTAIHNFYYGLMHTPTEEDIQAYLDVAPSVQPKPKTGHWIVTTDCEGKTRKCTCDKCGYETGQYAWHNPNYCENCGAKMER